MRILVGVKQVLDPHVRVRFEKNGAALNIRDLKKSTNPFDDMALEQAIRLKEAGFATDIVVVSVGTRECEAILRRALAMGADRAILVETDALYDSFQIATLFKAMIMAEEINCVILGKQAIDDDNAQVGPMLAGLLNWAQGIAISEVIVRNHVQEIEIAREVDAGIERNIIRLPAVLTADLRLNEPRYITLPHIIQAKTKNLKIMNMDSLGVDLASQVDIVAMQPVKAHANPVQTTILDNMTSLLSVLKERHDFLS